MRCDVVLRLAASDKFRHSSEILRSRPMKSLVILSVSVLIAIAMAGAQDSDPKSSPTPDPTSSDIQEPALPTPGASPGDAGPILLPQSNELPANPGAEQPTRASMNRVSTKPSARET